MSTRAKRTLVLVDDEALFTGSTRRAGWSAGELLGFFDGENRSAWTALPETTFPGGPGSRRAADDREVAPPKYPAAYPLPDLSREDVRQAIERAGTFLRRITPHALAVHTREEAEPEKQIEQEDDTPPGKAAGPGILYGTWWHEFAQTIPWQQPVAAWQRKFVEAQARSPQPERAAREWELFRRSTLAQWLAEPGRLVQVELPFLWRKTGEGTCFEGVMDLAVYTERESAWRVIDWKTNRLGPAGSNGLVEVYHGQIQAYVRALREMLSAEVRGSLYLTQTGEWVPVE
jgi:hypothetical protein